jgi:hypothetical protein
VLTGPVREEEALTGPVREELTGPVREEEALTGPVREEEVLTGPVRKELAPAVDGVPGFLEGGRVYVTCAKEGGGDGAAGEQ